MKRILIVVALLVFASAAFAQQKVNKRSIRQATEELTALYSLSEVQQAKVYDIQERRLTNLAEIEHLKAEDYKTYLLKCRAVRIGTENALKRLLEGSQLEIFQVQMEDRRQREIEKMQALKQEGATKQEIEIALLEIQ